MIATDTPITLACGTPILVGAMKKGDYVTDHEGNTNQVVDVVLMQISCFKVVHDTGVFVCAPRHRVLVRTTNKGKKNMAPKMAENLLEGMKLITADGATSTVKNIFVVAPRKTSKIVLQSSGMYLADGVLHMGD